MKEYKFKKYQSRVFLVKNIRLNKMGINMGWEAYQLLNEPERVEVYYDEESKLIKLINSKEEDSYKIMVKPKPHFGIKLGKIMPMGTYKFIGSGIFKFDL